ncbi:hypothetical protein [Mycolicibacterium aubagnense]|uniref:Uncharacterized protein n=1 Tax=Mycolicibacterium aubagnense TaxID=319707 RepID=A0ABN5Z4Q2_9MYCO|nr:hypothetical protein [Mycolicibacterium aubagnense]BBX87984.1 hypothetical protein MAUB_58570 [Mycolicibacterium aubagnense]
MAKYTVIGAHCDGTLLVFGAVEGEHQVEGDLQYYGYQPWADHVEASTAQEACEKAARS